MRNIGLVAFTVTTCVLVPAVANLLDAGSQQRAKLGAADESSIELDGVQIEASLDRWMLDPGDRLTVRLTASHATKKQLRVGVLVLGSNGDEGDRVPGPPTGVAHEIVTLDFKDGEASKTVTVKPRGALQNEWQPFGHYSVIVADPKLTAKLDKLRARSRFIGGGEGIPYLNKAGDQFMEIWRGMGGDSVEHHRGDVARLEAHMRPASSAIALAMPDTARAGEELVVRVTVQNPGRHKMAGLEVNLAEHTGVGDGVERGWDLLAIQPASITIDLAGKATQQLEFRVRGTKAGVVGLYARARCAQDGETCRDVQALGLGTFDAIEILAAETKTPEVAAR